MKKKKDNSRFIVQVTTGSSRHSVKHQENSKSHEIHLLNSEQPIKVISPNGKVRVVQPPRYFTVKMRKRKGKTIKSIARSTDYEFDRIAKSINKRSYATRELLTRNKD